jgi:hypothetical protein
MLSLEQTGGLDFVVGSPPSYFSIQTRVWYSGMANVVALRDTSSIKGFDVVSQQLG